MWAKAREERPRQKGIELALRGGLQECLTLGTMVCGARGNLLDGVRHRPVPSGSELAHGVQLHGQGVLIVRGDTGIEGDAHGWHKTPPQSGQSGHCMSWR